MNKSHVVCNNGSSMTTRDESTDNFYELPYIDAVSSYDFKQPNNIPNAAPISTAIVTETPVPKQPTALVGMAKSNGTSTITQNESFKFKTFSARKYSNENSKRSSQLIGLNNPE